MRILVLTAIISAGIPFFTLLILSLVKTVMYHRFEHSKGIYIAFMCLGACILLFLANAESSDFLNLMPFVLLIVSISIFVGATAGILIGFCLSKILEQGLYSDKG